MLTHGTFCEYCGSRLQVGSLDRYDKISGMPIRKLECSRWLCRNIEKLCGFSVAVVLILLMIGMLYWIHP